MLCWLIFAYTFSHVLTVFFFLNFTLQLIRPHNSVRKIRECALHLCVRSCVRARVRVFVWVYTFFRLFLLSPSSQAILFAELFCRVFLHGVICASPSCFISLPYFLLYLNNFKATLIYYLYSWCFR